MHCTLLNNCITCLQHESIIAVYTCSIYQQYYHLEWTHAHLFTSDIKYWNCQLYTCYNTMQHVERADVSQHWPVVNRSLRLMSSKQSYFRIGSLLIYTTPVFKNSADHFSSLLIWFLALLCLSLHLWTAWRDVLKGSPCNHRLAILYDPMSTSIWPIRRVALLQVPSRDLFLNQWLASSSCPALDSQCCMGLAGNQLLIFISDDVGMPTDNYLVRMTYL